MARNPFFMAYYCPNITTQYKSYALIVLWIQINKNHN